MMEWFNILMARLRALFRRESVLRDIEEELRVHIEMETETNIKRGMPPDEARAAALKSFGNLGRKTELGYDIRGGGWLETLWQDLRYGARMLMKNPGFTLAAMITLAVGIGANTAIFSFINALMLRSLPVKEPQELALLSIVGAAGAGGSYSFNYPLYETFRDRTQSFIGLACASGVGRARMTAPAHGADNGVESIKQQRVSGNFFSLLGVNPALGRLLDEADDNLTNAQPAAVISYEYWRRRFGLDPWIVGRRVTVNDIALTIVGVAPPGFFGFEVDSKPELWWAIKAMNDPMLRQNTSWWLRIFGRLRPEVSRGQAQTELGLMFRQFLDADVAARGANWTPTMRQRQLGQQLSLESGSAGYADLRRELRQPLLILMLTVALVLMIACVNIANLLLARATIRRKEIAVRLALGAGRFRLVRQLLTESVLLAGLGGVMGLFFAYAGVRALLTYLPPQTQTTLDVAPDARVLIFTLAVSVLTGLLFGLAPAWQATRLNLTASLKDQTGGGARRFGLTLNKSMVVTQVALSLFLLIGAGLFVRSLRNLRSLDAGFNHENILQFRIDTGGKYNDAQRSNLHRQMLARLEALPGARSATLLGFSLLSGNSNANRIVVPGYTPRPDEDMACKYLTIGPRFFETMEMPILAGRDFGLQDERQVVTTLASDAPPNLASEDRPVSAVINQTMARHFFGAENPLGKRFRLRSERTPMEVIGVVKDAKYQTLREPTPRTYYLYYFQQPSRPDMTFQLRTSGAAARNGEYGASIVRLAREIDPRIQVVGLRTMMDVVNQSLVQERFTAQVASAFSLFALLLACVGLYGVMSYVVTRRTSEIGIRLALGARPAKVVGLVMREALWLVALGAGAGLAAALATTRFVSSLLFGLTPTDPLTIALATLLLLLVAALASYLPARRASRVDPLVALRHE